MIIIGSRCATLFRNGQHWTNIIRQHIPNLICKNKSFISKNRSSLQFTIKFNYVEPRFNSIRLSLSCIRSLSTKVDPRNYEKRHRIEPAKLQTIKKHHKTLNFNEKNTDELSSFKPQSNRIYTIPNLLCMFRIGITPIIGYLIVGEQYDYALALCAISAVTDFLDGWIARTFNSESKLGALLDPLADKLLVATLTFALAYTHLIPLWLAGLILTRDLLIVMGGLYLRFRSIIPPRTMEKFFEFGTFKSDRFRPTLISKVNTGFQLSLVLVTLSSPLFPTFFESNYIFLQALQASTGITTLWSGLNYLTRLK